MRILFTTVSIDEYTSDVELSTIERYRTTLLARPWIVGVRNASSPRRHPPRTRVVLALPARPSHRFVRSTS